LLAHASIIKRRAVATAARGINVGRKWFKDYMRWLGFEWVPTMKIGSGCKVQNDFVRMTPALMKWRKYWRGG